jgi:hypothetical protein
MDDDIPDLDDFADRLTKMHPAHQSLSFYF